MQRRPQSHFDGFQIDAASAVSLAEEQAQETLYFARNFLLDRFGRFFSSARRSSPATGRC